MFSDTKHHTVSVIAELLVVRY